MCYFGDRLLCSFLILRVKYRVFMIILFKGFVFCLQY